MKAEEMREIICAVIGDSRIGIEKNLELISEECQKKYQRCNWRKLIVQPRLLFQDKCRLLSFINRPSARARSSSFQNTWYFFLTKTFFHYSDYYFELLQKAKLIWLTLLLIMVLGMARSNQNRNPRTVKTSSKLK